jgi:S1-C subfamily serine protease
VPSRGARLITDHQSPITNQRKLNETSGSLACYMIVNLTEEPPCQNRTSSPAAVSHPSPSHSIRPPASRFGFRISAFFRVSAFGLRTFPLLLLLTLSPAPAALAAEPDVRRDAAVAAIEQVMPSVVNIATETIIPCHDFYEILLRDFYGLPREQKSISLGSGVIIDEEGYVLTNFHVVRRASRIQIKLWDGREYDADPCVYTEASDVALLKLRAKPGEKFKAIKFAPDDDLLLGETVLALGNPFGLGGSVTKGILSSKNRRPATGNEPLKVDDWLQTDAAINPGNSGGPLVNLRGELIGLNVAVYREEHGERGMGVGFSIPVKQVAAALSQFFTPEVTHSLWFGAQLKAGSGPLEVATVQPGSPAAHAGLRAGDRVLQVNGQATPGLIAFNRLLTAGAAREARLLLGKEREPRTVSVHLVPFDELIRQKLGLGLIEPTPQTAERLGVRPGEGLVVEEVEKDGPAERAKFQRGYVLAGIDDQRARGLRTIGEVLSGKKRGETVVLTIIAPRRLGARYMGFQSGTVELVVR